MIFSRETSLCDEAGRGLVRAKRRQVMSRARPPKEEREDKAGWKHSGPLCGLRSVVKTVGESMSSS